MECVDYDDFCKYLATSFVVDHGSNEVGFGFFEDSATVDRTLLKTGSGIGRIPVHHSDRTAGEDDLDTSPETVDQAHQKADIRERTTYERKPE